MLSYSWSIVPPVTPSDVAPRAASVAPNLVTGMIRPFRRAEKDFATASGNAEIMAGVGQVLGTVRGTLPWDPGFGSNLERLRHKGNTPILRETARVYVDDALRQWLPAASLVDVGLPTKNKANEVELRVTVRIGNKEEPITLTL